MISMNPQSLSLLAAAASGIFSAVPKGQLARFGLVRAPLAAPLAIAPVPLAAAAGVLAVALAVPSSRRWLISKATTLTNTVRSKLLAASESGDASTKPVSATDGAKRPAKARREKASANRKPAVSN